MINAICSAVVAGWLSAASLIRDCPSGLAISSLTVSAELVTEVHSLRTNKRPGSAQRSQISVGVVYGCAVVGVPHQGQSHLRTLRSLTSEHKDRWLVRKSGSWQSRTKPFDQLLAGRSHNCVGVFEGRPVIAEGGTQVKHEVGLAGVVGVCHIALESFNVGLQRSLAFCREHIKSAAVSLVAQAVVRALDCSMSFKNRMGVRAAKTKIVNRDPRCFV
jgi:hypothetical protein